MSFSRLWTIARLELLQRVRTVSWSVLLGVFGLVLLGTALYLVSPVIPPILPMLGWAALPWLRRPGGAAATDNAS